MNQKQRPFISALLICSSYLLLTIFYHHIDKHVTGALFITTNIIIVLCYVLIVLGSLKSIITLLRSRDKIKNHNVTSAIYLVTLTYVVLSPYRLDSERLESEVVLRACYEGTQNQSYVKFRADKTFEMNWTGIFGYDEWWTGSWRRNGDTLFLKYNGKKIRQFGDTIVVANGYLNPLNRPNGKYNPKQLFYLGYCRHEN